MTNDQKIKDFIKNNGLTFTVGRRNSDSTVLAGYALHLGYDTTETSDLNKLIRSVCKGTKADAEFARVFDFAENNNYGSYWKTKNAAKKYTF